MEQPLLSKEEINKRLDGVAELYDDLFLREEIKEILTKANIPFSLAQEWDEVLKDPQAWATDCFYEKEYPSGKRAVVRNPVRFREAGLPEYNCGPQLGENAAEILSQIGYSREEIEAMKQQGIICMRS